MLGGDLSDRPEQRWLFVWEGCLAFLPPALARKESRLVARGRLSKALDLWETNEPMRRRFNDITMRQGQAVDVVSTHPYATKPLLSDRLGDEGWLFNRLLMYPGGLMDLSADLAIMVEIGCVVHGEFSRPFLFGSKGLCAVTPGKVR